MGVACNDPPCTELSKQICRCEAETRDESACVERVDQESSQRELSDGEQRVCADILEAESCSCTALRQGDLEACGLDQPGKGQTTD